MKPLRRLLSSVPQCSKSVSWVPKNALAGCKRMRGHCRRIRVSPPCRFGGERYPGARAGEYRMIRGLQDDGVRGKRRDLERGRGRGALKGRRCGVWGCEGGVRVGGNPGGDQQGRGAGRVIILWPHQPACLQASRQVCCTWIDLHRSLASSVSITDGAELERLHGAVLQ